MITYCVVTKGRRDFLPSALKALSSALDFQGVNVVIIDNGCPADISESLKRWCAQYSNRAHFLRFDDNETGPTRVWVALQKMDIEWITFPGDDDVVNPVFLELLTTEIRENPNLIAVAASMRIIDSSGTLTGEIRRPADFSGLIPSYLAGAFSEPPFLFPALFFKFKALETKVPASRYVFDWWLSLSLISMGAFKVTNSIAIDYRVHQGQESAVAPSRRKYFEAQIILSRFIDSIAFNEFISRSTPEDISIFWSALKTNRPIYQDREFGNYLMTLLGEKLANCTGDIVQANRILGELANTSGVLLRPGEMRSLSNRELNSASLKHANFQITLAEETCPRISSLIVELGVHLKAETNFTIGCKHSNKPYEFLIVCEKMIEDPGLWLDNLIVRITKKMEIEGKFSFTISPSEKLFIAAGRRIKVKLPHVLIKRVKGVTSRTHKLGEFG
jgi:hypothetical protein